MLKNKKRLSVGIILVSTLLILGFLPSILNLKVVLNDAEGQTYSSEEKTEEDLSSIIDNLSSAGGIENFKVKSSEATAILIPQTHRYPGSGSSESVNDSAQTAQEQIYEIVSFLFQEAGVGFVMMEGEIYGDIPEEKIKNLSQKIRAKEEFSNHVEKLKPLLENENINPLVVKNFIESSNAFMAEKDREIILEGASYVLKAEGKELTIFGSENKETLQKCTEVVRNYIYLQDRKEQLTSSENLSMASLYRLLSLNSGYYKNTPEEKVSEDISMIAGSCHDPKVIDELNRTKTAFNDLIRPGETDKTSSSYLPKRQDNPYSDIDSVSKINTLMAQSEEEINDWVVETRNREVADNFLKALEEKGLKSGIIQFGAGHKQGLVEELNKRNISVIVITPKEVQEKENDLH